MVVQNASRTWPRVYPGKSSTRVPVGWPDSAGGDSRRGRGGDTRRTEVLVPRSLPRAVGLHLLDRVADLGAQLGVALLQADAVALLRAQLLVVLQRLGAGDVCVVRLHQQALPGDQVRPGEADLLLARVGDGVGD